MTRRCRAGNANVRPIELQLARLVDDAPEGEHWIHETKYDGFRVLIERRGPRVQLSSRNGLDWTDKLPHIAQAVRKLPCENCVLDGELVALDAKGNANFGLLQQWMGARSEGIVVYIFDLLRLDGRDLRPQPLHERRARLQSLLRKARDPLRLSQIEVGDGDRAYRRACAEGLEGIISKRRDAPYVGGRSGGWLKVKCVASDEFVVIGYTPGKGARERLGSVLLAKPQRGGKYRYVGRVGSGFTETLIDQLFHHAKRRAQAVPLVETPSRGDLRGAQPVWVEPRVIVEVNHRGLTQDGRVRQGSIKGLRPDKAMRDLKRSDREVTA